MILINARFLTQQTTGVQRYAAALCRQIKETKKNVTFVCPTGIVDHELASYLDVKIIGKTKGHIWEQVTLPLYLRGKGNPVCISFCGLGPLLYNNSVYTIHDMSPYHEPNWFGLMYLVWYKFAYYVISKKESKIITVSDFSKNEIMKYLNVSPDRLITIYNVCSFESLADNTLSENKIILAVSSLEPRKNFSSLINAMQYIEGGATLIIVGKSGNIFNNSKSLTTNNLKVKFAGFVSDDELRVLYQTAAVFVYPSIYEGFGIPLLEAMSQQCPIACSNIPSFKEVTGDAALYFNPESEQDIARSISQIINNRKQSEQLITNGVERLKKFDIEIETNKLFTELEYII